jgi:IS5 family transposase
MSICLSGIDDRVAGDALCINISHDHPLVRLSNVLPWSEMAELVLPELHTTTAKGKWWFGRPLKLRSHLGVYLLQQLFNKTDRQIEYDVKDNAAYQLFSGVGIVDKWHCPDHTKIEEFRSRLSPEVQQKLANHLAVVADRLGFANPNKLDIDSTVQEANMAYPSDVHLLTKLGIMAKKTWSYLAQKTNILQFEPMAINLKEIKAKARACFFNKSQDIKEKNRLLYELWTSAFEKVAPMFNVAEELLDKVDWAQMPWNVKRAAQQLLLYGRQHFLDIYWFLNNGTMQASKRLSFHIAQVACFNKGKLSKGLQFGRAFQLARIAGNFLIVGKCNSVRMGDKESLRPMIETHQELFGKSNNVSVATDKGYYSKNNVYFLECETLEASGLQKPGSPRASPTKKESAKQADLVNRRAGIEPLIGHTKHGGQLGKSRMKYDRTTESSGYCAVLGFNGRQLIRYLKGAAVFAG